MSIQNMAEKFMGHITDAILIGNDILGEADPQTEEASDCIGDLSGFQLLLKKAWGRAESSLREIAGYKP